MPVLVSYMKTTA